MGTDSTDISPDSQDLTSGPFSVSLKVNRTNASLYRNYYIPRSSEQPGFSKQQLLCSFSIHKTEIPINFHNHLLQATTGQPDRYEQLMQRLKTRVLEPARQRQQEREQREQRARMQGWLNLALNQVQQAACCAYRDAHLGNPQIQQAVLQLLQETKPLLFPPNSVAAETKTVLNSSQAEQKLQQALQTLLQGYQQIQQMLSRTGGQFAPSYQFDPETVHRVQQLWFRHSDVIAACSRYKPLKRANHWSQMRDKVMGSSHVEPVEYLDDTSEHSLPGEDISLTDITEQAPE
ncbi:MAG: hypothetical protein PHX60_15385 [Giesbergeria sp.]|uniref:hypothetical protein n=1 Tax=Giesbergeria sp. TaxID=2818473 RepID=UPI00261365AA|nr:hypothetical protein [Giesbergeria sp.]MDD2611035.1 hypothetical protein [Giesbergeria sp.]